LQIDALNRWAAAGNPDLRGVLVFVRGRQDPPSADDVATALGLPRSVARWRLERLVALGFLRPVFVRRSGRTGPGAGRPAKTYAVVPETAALEFPPRRYEELLRRVLAALPSRARRARLREIGIAFGHDLARAATLRPVARPTAAFDRISRALGKLGFQVTVESVSVDEVVLVTPTCPLRPIVVADETARAIDIGMWLGLVEAALRGADAREIVCTTHDCSAPDASCRVRFRLGEASAVLRA
jgi:predicted ArsR family transcriptional regulator